MEAQTLFAGYVLAGFVGTLVTGLMTYAYVSRW